MRGEKRTNHQERMKEGVAKAMRKGLGNGMEKSGRVNGGNCRFIIV